MQLRERRPLTCPQDWPTLDSTVAAALNTDTMLPGPLSPCYLTSACSQLTQQPSKLPEFIAFRLAVRAIRQQQDYLLVALPAQVAGLYNSVTSWGFRLPSTDQVRHTVA
jgi:hypothetical protein